MEGLKFFALCLLSFLASGLTLYSGFGLGTLLMPAFALFFPVESAIAMTAIVHLANNLFKLALLGPRADRGTVLRFGLPAMAASFVGAKGLVWLADLPTLYDYELWGQTKHVAIVKLVAALLMAGFASLEANPQLSSVSFPRRWLTLGGLLSGFFGGLTGSQGALRSAFLLRSELGKEEFIATGIAVACLVDLSRLSVYSSNWNQLAGGFQAPVLAMSMTFAFLGAWLGSRLMPKVTMRGVHVLVASLLWTIAAGLAAGLL